MGFLLLHRLDDLNKYLKELEDKTILVIITIKITMINWGVIFDRHICSAFGLTLGTVLLLDYSNGDYVADMYAVAPNQG